MALYTPIGASLQNEGYGAADDADEEERAGEPEDVVYGDSADCRDTVTRQGKDIRYGHSTSSRNSML